MSKTITIRFSQKSITDAIKQIKEYCDYVAQKTNELREEIAKIGYECAENNVEGFDGIVFEIRDQGEYTLLVGWSNKQIRTWWNSKEGQVINNDYSPILMAEYGSGRYADAEHRGTFPTGKGNGLKEKWAYREKEGSPFILNEGEEPTRPMEKAYMEMLDRLYEVTKKVFSGE